MTKKPFTTRLDPAILELAKRLAQNERRSITTLIEVALVEYAERRGLKVSKILEATHKSEHESSGGK